MDDRQQERSYASRSSRHHHKSPKTPQSTKAKKGIRLSFALLLLAVFLISGVAVSFAGIHNWLGSNKPPVDISTLPPEEQQAAREERALQNINILLVGCDQRGAEAARADTIMLATLRPVDKEVSLLSIPRDTLVNIAGHGRTRINHALAYGDMPLLQKTLEDLLDTDIDYAAKVNFEGFKDIIDALGGVQIDVERRMYKPLENIDLQPGSQRLNGYDALAYVRWRGDAKADLGRIERQQKFLAALVEGIKNMNLKEALSVASVVMDNLETDMGVADMTYYGTQFLGITAADIETHSLIGKPITYNGMECLEIDQSEIERVMDLMKYGNPEEPAPEDDEGDTEGENESENE